MQMLLVLMPQRLVQSQMRNPSVTLNNTWALSSNNTDGNLPCNKTLAEQDLLLLWT